MNPSSLYRISLVICLWQCVELKQVLQLSQQATFKLCLRKFCIEPAVRLEQFKISSRQSCYKECLLKIRNQNLAVGTQQTKLFLKRIKRELSNGKDSSAQAVALRGDEECKKASNNATIIPSDNINVTFLKFGDTERLYANVSWNLPPNKTANWTGYKMIYLMGSHKSPFNCRNLEKNATFAIVDNSSKGLLQKKRFYVMLTSLPFLSGNSAAKDFKFKNIKLRQLADEVKQPKTSRSPGSGNISIKVALPAVASIIVVLIGVAVLVRFYLRPSNLETVACDHTLITGYEFDVFIIYSTADSPWVTEELVPTLEKHNINYCIHYKHFIPGVAYTRNMSNSVYNSRKVVAVVSKYFLQSSFCSEELDMALYRLTKEKDDSVIVIKLNDFSNRELPDQLRHRSYIDFTKSTDKNTWEEKLVKVFKEKGCSKGPQLQS